MIYNTVPTDLFYQRSPQTSILNIRNLIFCCTQLVYPNEMKICFLNKINYWCLHKNMLNTPLAYTG